MATLADLESQLTAIQSQLKALGAGRVMQSPGFSPGLPPGPYGDGAITTLTALIPLFVAVGGDQALADVAACQAVIDAVRSQQTASKPPYS